MIENDIVFVEEVPKAEYLSFCPDGREVYLHYYAFQVGVYRLEYEYKVK